MSKFILDSFALYKLSSDNILANGATLKPHPILTTEVSYPFVSPQYTSQNHGSNVFVNIEGTVNEVFVVYDVEGGVISNDNNQLKFTPTGGAITLLDVNQVFPHQKVLFSFNTDGLGSSLSQTTSIFPNAYVVYYDSVTPQFKIIRDGSGTPQQIIFMMNIDAFEINATQLWLHESDGTTIASDAANIHVIDSTSTSLYNDFTWQIGKNTVNGLEGIATEIEIVVSGNLNSVTNTNFSGFTNVQLVSGDGTDSANHYQDLPNGVGGSGLVLDVSTGTINSITNGGSGYQIGDFLRVSSIAAIFRVTNVSSNVREFTVEFIDNTLSNTGGSGLKVNADDNKIIVKQSKFPSFLKITPNGGNLGDDYTINTELDHIVETYRKMRQRVSGSLTINGQTIKILTTNETTGPINQFTVSGDTQNAGSTASVSAFTTTGAANVPTLTADQTVTSSAGNDATFGMKSGGVPDPDNIVDGGSGHSIGDTFDLNGFTITVTEVSFDIFNVDGGPISSEPNSFTISSGSASNVTINETRGPESSTGSGINATFKLVNGVITELVNPGSGYKTGDTITINGQTLTINNIIIGSGATFNVDNLGVPTTIISEGTNYRVGEQINVNNVVVTINSIRRGEIQTYEVSGTPTDTTLNGNHSVGDGIHTATFNLTNGVVDLNNIVSKGHGYYTAASGHAENLLDTALLNSISFDLDQARHRIMDQFDEEVLSSNLSRVHYTIENAVAGLDLSGGGGNSNTSHEDLDTAISTYQTFYDNIATHQDTRADTDSIQSIFRAIQTFGVDPNILNTKIDSLVTNINGPLSTDLPAMQNDITKYNKQTASLLSLGKAQRHLSKRVGDQNGIEFKKLITDVDKFMRHTLIQLEGDIIRKHNLIQQIMSGITKLQTKLNFSTSQYTQSANNIKTFFESLKDNSQNTGGTPP